MEFHYSRMCIANDTYHVCMHVCTNVPKPPAPCFSTPVLRQKDLSEVIVSLNFCQFLYKIVFISRFYHPVIHLRM